MLYKVKDSDINLKNKHYPIGSEIELKDNEAEGLENYLEPLKTTKVQPLKNPKDKPKVNKKSNAKSKTKHKTK